MKDSKILSPKDRVLMQLMTYESLQEGWGHQSGKVLPKKGIEWVREMLTKWADKDIIPMPFLYPLASGQLVGEWQLGNWEAHVYFMLDTYRVNGFAENITGNYPDQTFHDATQLELWLTQF